MTLWKRIKDLIYNGWSVEFTENIRRNLMWVAATIMFIIFVISLAILVGLMMLL